MHARVHTHTCVLARVQAEILRRQLELKSLYYVAVVARAPARPPVPAATYARLRAATTVVRCRVTAAEIARCASAVITSSALRSSSRGELPYPSGMASDRSPSRSRRKRMSLLAGTVASATARWITRHTAGHRTMSGAARTVPHSVWRCRCQCGQWSRKCSVDSTPA
jgi:hypothetical protein